MQKWLVKNTVQLNFRCLLKRPDSLEVQIWLGQVFSLAIDTLVAIAIDKSKKSIDVKVISKLLTKKLVIGFKGQVE